MCELFAVNARREVVPNAWLREFFSHCEKNPHGWGMAMFYGDSTVALEKEPVKAGKSRYLFERLRQDIYVRNMIAHLRDATIGVPEYGNTHPFVNRDMTGRCWTLAHNGTIFKGDVLQPYVDVQEGKTDSERILYYIIDRVDRMTEELGREATVEERCMLIEDVVRTLSPESKVNLVLFDGDVLYTHSNLAGTLHRCPVRDALLFATVPFPVGSQDFWEEVPQRRLCAYRGGEQIFEGAEHPYSYVEDPEKMQSLFAAFAEL